MDDPDVPAAQPDDESGGPSDEQSGAGLSGSGSDASDRTPDQPIRPGAARRRFASEMKALREAVGLSCAEAGEPIDRTAATISRFEKGKYLPRLIEVTALLDRYAEVDPAAVPDDLRERILFYFTEAKEDEWFESFRSSTGGMVPEHLFQFVGYETDAYRLRNYESDLVPGLLQTEAYARAVAELYFPDRRRVEYGKFAEFRMVRQRRLRERGDGIRLAFVVNEVALRRVIGEPAILRGQLDELARIVRDDTDPIALRIVSMSTAIPAALSGSFAILSFPDGYDIREIVYLESRSGADYLSGEDAISRFNGYWDSLLASCLSPPQAIELVESIRAGLQE